MQVMGMKIEVSSHLLVHLIIYYMCHQPVIACVISQIGSMIWGTHQKYVAMKSCTNIYGLKRINSNSDIDICLKYKSCMTLNFSMLTYDVINHILISGSQIFFFIPVKKDFVCVYSLTPAFL